MRIRKIIKGRRLWILLTAVLTLGTGLPLLAFGQSPSIILNRLETVEMTPSTPAVLPPTDAGKSMKTTVEPLPQLIELDPADWKTWPEIPTVTQHAREIYEYGLALGTNPRAFSIFGDCQSMPELFLGLYTTDIATFSALSRNLQETVGFFRGSLNRSSPTSKDGTTSGALLWEEWHENNYGCSPSETPMDCELRIHNPSLVLIMVGTHWEGNRNEFYLRRILDTLLERGVLPILSTKADNREGDNSINLQTARLAVEYNLPLWNFWEVVNHLPNRGLYAKESELYLGDIYLTEQALALRRFSALMALDAVWRAVTN